MAGYATKDNVSRKFTQEIARTIKRSGYYDRKR
jgi:hypothetical protein